MEAKQISVPALLKVGVGTLAHIGEYLDEKDIKKVVIYFGNGLIDLFGEKVLGLSLIHISEPTRPY